MNEFRTSQRALATSDLALCRKPLESDEIFVGKWMNTQRKDRERFIVNMVALIDGNILRLRTNHENESVTN